MTENRTLRTVLVVCATVAMLYLVIRGALDMFYFENTTAAVLRGDAGRRMLTLGAVLGALTALVCVVTGSRWWAGVLYAAGPLAAATLAWVAVNTLFPQIAVLVGFYPVIAGAALMVSLRAARPAGSGAD